MSLAIVNPEVYEQQLEEKSQLIRANFSSFDIPKLEVFPSAPQHYRMRAEFRVWHHGQRCGYAMFDPDSKKPFEVTGFPAGSRRIDQLMPMLMAAINQQRCLSHRLFQIDFLTTQSGQALVSLIYHKALDSSWEDAARVLQSQLDIAIIGRSRRQKQVLDRDHVIETLTVNGRSYHYQQVENSFTQPNASINEKMLSWASQCCQNSPGDLLELYCGNGNFTCVLAQHFNQVLATEIAKVSVHSARENFRLNQVNNVIIARLSSEELTQAMAGERVFRRLEAIDLDSYRFSTVFVDPPRAGLDQGTLAMVKAFDRILYISCNPDTLKANLESISATHAIERIALFDQFPYTHHAEMGVYLKRKA